MPAPPALRDPANLKGAAYVTLCCAFIAGSTLCAKALGAAREIEVEGLLEQAARLHPLQITFGRFLFGTLALLPFAMWKRPRFDHVPWRLHGARVVSGWLGVSLMFAAVSFMPLADATAISFLNPLFAMILALIFLKEGVGPWRWAAAAIAFAGAAIVTRPGTAAFDPAALLALGAALSIGAELIFIKRLADREPILRILLINNAFAAVIAGVATVFVWQAPSPTQWLLLAGTGAFMVTAQSLNLRGMAIAEASFIAPFFYATLLYAALYDWLFFAEVPAATTALGAACIIAGALILGWRERRAAARA
ncbi:DMT family transporter [Marivibrio halodurans]|uniref:DMT family transporter n=1 Tax=Marivibrio halodurans TaxID=2039722 RepID=UPI001FE5F7D1|nr:DMT family transporter [Marivibrio halodurans]